MYPRPADKARALEVRANRHCHLCPELYLGGPCQPAGDIFSVSRMVEKALDTAAVDIKPYLMDVLARCKEEDSEERPTIQELMAALERH